MNFRELSNEQRRQWLDFLQIDREHRQCLMEWDHGYLGSMRWLKRKNKEYLHVKRGTVEKSLGARSKETEHIFESFQSKRKILKQRMATLSNRLDAMAPVNRALGLGRVPRISSDIFRRLDAQNLLGTHLLIAGTNSLWAYESKAGVQFFSDVVATEDADLIWDPRLGVELLPSIAKRTGILKTLKLVDKTFIKRGPNDYSAINSAGFSVDIIRPEDHDFLSRSTKRDTLTTVEGDLSAAPLFGLQWLINSPRFECIAMGEDGYSVRIATVDPRAFVLHKLWLSAKEDRNPVKAKRDLDQALAVEKIARSYLNLKFLIDDLRALPKRVRDLLKSD
jgi:hypothetical protein